MDILRRVAVAFALLLGCQLPSLAQSWPQKSIKMIVPFAAGGGTDAIARHVARYLSERLGQQIFIDNRGGANGIVGLQALTQSEPDGYTIATISDTPLVVNPSLYDKVPYDPVRDFIPLALVVQFPQVLVVHPSVPVRSVSELIELAKSKPSSLAYSSGGLGNSGQLSTELFAMANGIKLVHVPYRGVGPATQALLAGDAKLMFNNVTTAIEHIRSGAMRPLGVSPDRMAELPDVPAIAETIPGFDVQPWVGLFAPANTPPEIVAKLRSEVIAVMRTPELVKLLEAQLMTPRHGDHEELSALIQRDLEKWAKVIQTTGMRGAAPN